MFRNGRKVADARRPPIDKGWVIEQMIGKGHEALEESYTEDDPAAAVKPTAPVVMEARQLWLGRACRDVSFEIRAGEVLGIYGFMGCGQLELARILFGKLRPDAGDACHRRKAGGASAAQRLPRSAGIAFVPESRRAMLFHQEPVYKNISIASSIVFPRSG